ncbi:MAG: alanine--tRNA ligase-related protein [Patescibacteria group bacterium]
MNQQLRESLLEYHRIRDFVLYESFPLVTNDPTVLFTNATITPFKHFFENQDVTPHNYALIQQCLRVGGGAGGLETAQQDPNYSSLFDMFGCGLFNCTYSVAVKYFIDMLGHIGLSKAKLRFTVPETSHFTDALIKNGIENSSIFAINENGEFWQEWRFGKNGLVGNGLTAIFAREDHHVISIGEMVKNPLSFVEIGNLIHIHGKAEDGKVVPVAHEGFEVGIGMERLVIALEGKTLYELSPFRELVNIVAKCLNTLGVADLDQGTLRVVTDHLRSIIALVREGVSPGNKQQAFVLRKLIRSVLEMIWLSVGQIVPSVEIVSAFAEFDSPGQSSLVLKIVNEEERVFRETLMRGKIFLTKNPLVTPEVLMDTYGIRSSLLPLINGS